MNLSNNMVVPPILPPSTPPPPPPPPSMTMQLPPPPPPPPGMLMAQLNRPLLPVNNNSSNSSTANNSEAMTPGHKSSSLAHQEDDNRDRLLADIRKGVKLKKCGHISKSQPYIYRLLKQNQIDQLQKTNGTTNTHESQNSRLNGSQVSQTTTDSFHSDLINTLNRKTKNNQTENKEKLLITHGPPNFQIKKKLNLKEYEHDSSSSNKASSNGLHTNGNNYEFTNGRTKFSTLPRAQPIVIKCETVQIQLANNKGESVDRTKDFIQSSKDLKIVVPPMSSSINSSSTTDSEDYNTSPDGPKTPVSSCYNSSTESTKNSIVNGGNKFPIISNNNSSTINQSKHQTLNNSQKFNEKRNESQSSLYSSNQRHRQSELADETNTYSITNAFNKFQTLDRRDAEEKSKNNWGYNSGHKHDLRMAHMITTDGRTKLSPSNNNSFESTKDINSTIKHFATLPRKQRGQTPTKMSHPAPNYVLPSKVNSRQSPLPSPSASATSPFQPNRANKVVIRRASESTQTVDSLSTINSCKYPSGERNVPTSFAKDLSAAPNRYPEKVEIRTYVPHTEEITFDNVKLNRIKFDINVQESRENTVIRMMKK